MKKEISFFFIFLNCLRIIQKYPIFVCLFFFIFILYLFISLFFLSLLFIICSFLSLQKMTPKKKKEKNLCNKRNFHPFSLFILITFSSSLLSLLSSLLFSSLLFSSLPYSSLLSPLSQKRKGKKNLKSVQMS